MKPTATSRATATQPLVVSCDVGMESLHLVCPAIAGSPFARVYAIDNRTEAIRMELTALRGAAIAAGHTEVRLVLEPTGIYDRLLQHIARELGFEVRLVNGEDVRRQLELRGRDN